MSYNELSKQFYDMLQESQYWSPEAMLDYQRRQLGLLLGHAKANVPFYRDQLNPVLRADGEVDWDALHRIPIITRRDIADHGSEMIATVLPKGHEERTQ